MLLRRQAARRRSSARRAAARSARSGGQREARAGERHDVHPHPVGQAGERVLAEVDQRGQDVVLARSGAVQRRDRVDGGAAGGQLVVDEHERARPGQQARVGRQQQVPGVVGVLLDERARRGDARHRTPGGVQVVRAAEGLGDAVAERRGRLGEAEHDGVDRLGRDRLPRPPRATPPRRPARPAPPRAAGRPAGRAADVRPARRRPARRAAARPRGPPAGRWGRACRAPARPAAAPAAGCRAARARAAPADRAPLRGRAAAPRAARRSCRTRRRSSHRGRLAAAGRRTTRPRPRPRTPATRSIVRRAQDRCGRISFILLRCPEGITPPARPGAEEVARVAVLLGRDDRQRVHGGDVPGVDGGLADEAVGLVELHLADQPVDGAGDQLAAQVQGVVLVERRLPQLRLEDPLVAAVVLPDRPGHGEAGAVGAAEHVDDVADQRRRRP